MVSGRECAMWVGCTMEPGSLRVVNGAGRHPPAPSLLGDDYRTTPQLSGPLNVLGRTATHACWGDVQGTHNL